MNGDFPLTVLIRENMKRCNGSCKYVRELNIDTSTKRHTCATVLDGQREQLEGNILGHE